MDSMISNGFITNNIKNIIPFIKNRLINNTHLPFWLLTFCFMTGLILPTLLKDGMFMDAVQYSAVSHNLANGIGSFWFPMLDKFNLYNLSSFHEQPPLAFGIQSFFFKALGSSMFVERFYTFLIMIITSLLIIYLWKIILKTDNQSLKAGWLPLLFWITIPVCFWSYSNNMLENTMGVFTLLSVLLTIKYFLQTRRKYSFLLIAISGIMIFLATLSKGLPGFFPIAVPLLYCLTIRKISFSRSLLFSFFLLLVPLILYTVIFVIPESKESLSNYLFKRCLFRINTDHTVENRWFILWNLFQNILPHFIFTGIIILALWRKNKKFFFYSYQSKLSFLFILIGLSGSVPIMITKVQRGFYLVPCLPFFAVGFSILIAPLIIKGIQKINTKKLIFKIYSMTTFLIMAGIIVVSVKTAGEPGRDKDMLHDVYIIGNRIPKHSVLGIPHELYNNWSLHCYFSRYFFISLDDGNNNNKYFLTNKKNTDKKILNQYKKFPINTFEFDLYEKK